MRRVYLVELFAGSHSVSKALARFLAGTFDVRVLSVDSDPTTNASVVADINRWNYKRDIDEFLKRKRAKDIVIVHASPPCTAFSLGQIPLAFATSRAAAGMSNER